MVHSSRLTSAITSRISAIPTMMSCPSALLSSVPSMESRTPQSSRMSASSSSLRPHRSTPGLIRSTPSALLPRKRSVTYTTSFSRLSGQSSALRSLSTSPSAISPVSTYSSTHTCRRILRTVSTRTLSSTPTNGFQPSCRITLLSRTGRITRRPRSRALSLQPSTPHAASPRISAMPALQPSRESISPIRRI